MNIFGLLNSIAESVGSGNAEADPLLFEVAPSRHTTVGRAVLIADQLSAYLGLTPEPEFQSLEFTPHVSHETLESTPENETITPVVPIQVAASRVVEELGRETRLEEARKKVEVA